MKRKFVKSKEVMNRRTPSLSVVIPLIIHMGEGP